MMKNYKNKQAFTFIELITVIVILVILVAILLPKFIGTNHQRDLVACQSNLKKLSSAFHLYLLDNNNYAPFNPEAGERSPANSFGASDCFYSWEVLYLLAPYLGDPDREKFYNGNLDIGRCPGNKCRLYSYGDNPIGGATPIYKDYYSNRQAPKTWNAADISTIIKESDRYDSTNVCDPNIYPQMMDYQYNNSLGGVFKIYGVSGMAGHEWFNAQGNKRYYKTNFIVKRPSEAVVFCDMQYANVHPYQSGSDTEKNEDKLTYGYNLGADQWGKNDQSIFPASKQGTYSTATAYEYLRTNETIHNGTGINAVFFDGHAEFIPAKEVFNSDVKRNNDILNWGVDYPNVVDPNTGSLYATTPGVRGYLRGKGMDTIDVYG